MKIDVYLDKVENHHLRQVKNAVKIINTAQNYFYLNEDFQVVLLTEENEVNYDKVKEKLNNEIPEHKYNLYITSKKFDDDWFSHEDRQFSIITIYDWEQAFAPPSLKTYIIYQIAQSLLGFEIEISEEMLLRIVHDPSKGCMFDFCSNKDDIKLGMVAGIICPECKATLITYGIKSIAIEAVERILVYVRSEAIGMPVLIESDLAFIVMRYTQNDENDNAFKYGIRAGLQDIGIRPERADTKVSSFQILEKIKKYIEKSRFIIAKVDEDNLNVFFELGLAMGAGKEVLLVSEENLVLKLPSDLKNWECLVYPKGNYEVLRNRISDYFEKNFFYSRKQIS